MGLPEEYRHLVDLKFVLGMPKEECRDRVNEVVCPGVAAEERAIQEEEQYGDLLRLDGLKGGENMDEGKTWEWLRHIGNGPREAQWVIKCDDDVSVGCGINGRVVVVVVGGGRESAWNRLA